ncbi:unnamed protein product [Rotaria magnacalcarata]|nr:unnamed protein product [Rotaria magnacalcarata]
MRATRLRLLPVTLPKLTKLERLDLGANSFIEFPIVLSNLPSLQELWLDANKLISIDDSIDKLTNLKFLDISQNQLTELPSSMGDCKLTDLYLSDNFLMNLPDSIVNLTSLETLTANNNQIERLPNNIGHMTSLVELHLSFNNLTSLPASIGLLHSLQFLTLDHNQIQSIPATIGSCSSLSILSLRSNCLASLPDEIGRLSLLKVLNVSGNFLRYLPCTLLKLKKLQALWMNENQAKPLIAFEQERHPTTGQRVLTCILLPQTDPSMNRNTSKSRFIAEQTADYTNRPTTLRFANDTIDEPRQLVRNPTPYPKEMRAFANILRNYNHSNQREIVQSPKKYPSSSNLLMVCDEIPLEKSFYGCANSASVGSMNSDLLCCPLARSHDDLLFSTSPIDDRERMRPDLLPGQVNDIDEVKSNHSF